MSITQANFRMDVAYFLLGSAAQGMGYNAAAIRYFKYAGALSSNASAVSEHCAAIGICYGISLPRDIYPRIQASEQAIAAQASQRALAVRLNDAQSRAQRAPPPAPMSTAQQPQQAASSAAPTEHSAWIDPPPATR